MLPPSRVGQFWTVVDWAMIDFVWIGLLTSLLVVLALVLLRRAHPKVRCRIALALLALGLPSLGVLLTHQLTLSTSPLGADQLAGTFRAAETKSGSPFSDSPARRIRFRLAPKSSAWTVGQEPIFAVGVRNLGDQKIHLCSSQAGWELEVDGTWYHGVPEAGTGTSTLFPGGEWAGLSVVLGGGLWQTWDKTNRQLNSLSLEPGRHRLRLRTRVTRYDPSNQDKRSFKITGNGVEFDVVEPIGHSWLAPGGTAIETNPLSPQIFVKPLLPNDHAQEARPEVGRPSRTLFFPTHCSLGTLYIQDRSGGSGSQAPQGLLSDSQWRYYALGKGLVVPPPNQRVWLDLEVPSEFRDLSPLTTLDPDALDTVTILGLGERRNDRDELLLAQLRNLTGLRVLGLNNIKVTPRAVGYLKTLRSLENLSIRSPFSAQRQTNGTLNDACLRTMAELTNLTRLRLTQGQITDEGLAELAGLSGLEELDLESDRIEGRGLVHLKQLPKLRSLRLRGPAVNAMTVARLVGLNSLRNMDLANVTLTNPILEGHWDFPLLEELTIHDAHITREGLSFLKSLPSLRRLSIWSGDSNRFQIGVEEASIFIALRSLEKLDLHHAVVTDAALAQLAGLPRLKSLQLPSVSEIEPSMDRLQYSDLGLASLAGCSGLEEISVGSLRVTDAGVGSIGHLKHLKRLVILAPRISNAALRSIALLTSLEFLALEAPRVTFSGLNQLNTLTNLRELHLASVQRDRRGLNLCGLTQLEALNIQRRGIETDALSDSENWTDQDMACLASLPKLRRLWGIRGVSDRGMQHLIRLDSLEWLDIGGLAVTDASVAYLGNMRNLKHVALHGKITDHGLRGLERLKSLRYLSLGSEATISEGALNRLRQILPELKVNYGLPALGAGG